MKLRIRGNSLRLRLTKTEIEKLRKTQRVEESIQFGMGNNNTIIYLIEASRSIEAPKVLLEGLRIIVSFPWGVIEDWTTTEQVGISFSQSIPEDGPLKVLVEKDFACLKPREGEDDSDAFPHPAENSGETC